MTAIRVCDVQLGYTEYRYRTPIKFGGVAFAEATLLDVTLTCEDKTGRRGVGFGSMPLGNVWSFPSRVVGYAQSLQAMKALAERLRLLFGQDAPEGHPIEVTCALEPAFYAVANEVSRELGLAEPIPRLCTLVTASPFDAALHDAYGKLLGLNCYRTYSREFLRADLGQFLGPEFREEYLDRYLLGQPVARMPLYHLVGALDPLSLSDVAAPVGDGLPECLSQWIERDGLTHLKIKLDGQDLDWDVDRLLRVEAVARETQTRRGVAAWFYSLDFNERCQSVEYLLEFLERIRKAAPEAYQRIQYIEQPTARDLTSQRHNAMHAAARLKPIVIDESLIDLESLRLARELGYTGAALKACKGQTQSLLLAAAIQKFGMFRCVQDLTCPGASLIHSAGLAAHVPGVAALEANARQYMPQANRGWQERFPTLFQVRDGQVETGILTGPGLGAVP
jgi:L-alanine-DL-glutamate epimerase-like enolase superfamily enzyme